MNFLKLSSFIYTKLHTLIFAQRYPFSVRMNHPEVTIVSFDVFCFAYLELSAFGPVT